MMIQLCLVAGRQVIPVDVQKGTLDGIEQHFRGPEAPGPNSLVGADGTQPAQVGCTVDTDGVQPLC
ncbi:hypothetical protein D3C84_1252070 [compost metagenome]